nr:TIGR03667 family PPOX class F420-dependent oxidoreductase [Anaerolineae bacterium]
MPFTIDTTTPFGERVERRLNSDRIIWLTTVDSKGRPQPRPVWFLWTGEEFLILSRPEGFKLRHIRQNPHVALNLDGDGQGGDIIVVLGEGQVVDKSPSESELEAFLAKYADGVRRLGLTPEQFKTRYKVHIWITPTGLRGH